MDGRGRTSWRGRHTAFVQRNEVAWELTMTMSPAAARRPSRMERFASNRHHERVHRVEVIERDPVTRGATARALPPSAMTGW
jgi:hypothetical protein